MSICETATGLQLSKISTKKHESESPYTYRFTDGDVLEIVRLINSKRIQKQKVMEMLFNGRR